MKMYITAWAIALFAFALLFAQDMDVLQFFFSVFAAVFALIFATDLIWKSRVQKELILRDPENLWHKRLGRGAFNVIRLALLGYGALAGSAVIGGLPTDGAGVHAGGAMLTVLFLGMFDRVRVQKRASKQSAEWMWNYRIMLEVLRLAAENSQGELSLFDEVLTSMRKGFFTKAGEVSGRLRSNSHLNGIVQALATLGSSTSERKVTLQHLVNVKKRMNTTRAYLDACIAGLEAIDGGEDYKDLTTAVVEDMKELEHKDWRLRLQVARNYTLCNDLDAARRQIEKIYDEPESERKEASKLLSGDVLLRTFLGGGYMDGVLKRLQHGD